jgi:acetyl-CoA C-acetyltransferase
MMKKVTFGAAQRRLFSSGFGDRDAVVVSFARTPIGKLAGALSSLTAPRLGAHAISAAVDKSGIAKKDFEEAFIGNVVSSGIGQAPARQATVYAGLELGTDCTTINKVCASGMKAVMLSALSINAGYRNVMIAGGMESMSNIPYYLPGARTGYRLGNNTVVDGLISDGLWDIYNNQHMGNCGEACAAKFKITREEQDAYAVESYERALRAWNSAKFDDEVVPISIATKKGQEPTLVTRDEEPAGVKLDKMKSLKPAFLKDGTVTAANASKL